MRRGGSLMTSRMTSSPQVLEVAHIEGVESDPSVETVMSGAKMPSSVDRSLLSAALPTDAKAMWIKYE